jgi:hypothetical protein
LGTGGRREDGGGQRKFYADLIGGLVAHVAYHARLNTVDGEQGSIRQNLETAAKNPMGQVDPRIFQGPPLAPALRYLAGWFGELAGSRASGFGVGPIEYVEIEAWARLTGRNPDPIEVRAIRALDLATRAIANEKPAERQKAIHAWLTSQA